MKYNLKGELVEGLDIIDQILVNRGFKLEDIEHYLKVNEFDNLSPSLLDNIQEAAELIIKHLADEQLIYLIVDSDCDGYVSASLMLNYLHCLVPTIIESKARYNFHDGKIHGIEMDLVPDNTGLVLAIDSASNDFEQHKLLKNQGIDVVVIDHHIADKVSEDACVVNNQLCDYPTKSLSGVGVAYKVCQKIDELTNNSFANNFLDLVALGCVADMVSLKDFETHYLIQEGCNQIVNPYLKYMIKKNEYQLADNINPTGLAFYVAPYINAITRSGTLEEKNLLFESMLNWKAYDEIPSTKQGAITGSIEKRVEQAVRVSCNVKSRQDKAKKNNIETIKNIIEAEDNFNRHKILIAKLDKNINLDRNLFGLIANELAKEYCRPIMILKENNDKFEGSCRGYERFEIKDFRSFVEQSGFAEYAQGHPNAFGASFASIEHLENFIEYADNKLSDVEIISCYEPDFILNSENSSLIQIIGKIDMYKNLWGKEIEEPLVVIEDIILTKENVSLIGKNKNALTLKIRLPIGVDCVKFRSNQEEFEKLIPYETGFIKINLIGKASINRWGGYYIPQIIIEEYEIIDTQQYYF